jgi:hypothetical protein
VVLAIGAPERAVGAGPAREPLGWARPVRRTDRSVGGSHRQRSATVAHLMVGR